VLSNLQIAGENPYLRSYQVFDVRVSLTGIGKKKIELPNERKKE